jgi:predicted restriction endonuclease
MLDYSELICRYQLEVHNGFYSEVHHIWPLGEGGLDNFDNMIVLCPNHHAEFDMCAIGIDPDDGSTVIDSNSNVKGRAIFLGFHKLATSNLKYHYKKIIQK